jgi:2-keto-4-pentenoate hydratase/2-oxohepta-3-ene-1,7-dioic acid hydratase in catechol pathway
MIRALVSALAASAILAGTAVGQDGVTRYVRYEHQGEVSYGVLEGETIHQLAGDLFSGSRERTGKSVPTGEARLLAPAQPSKVIAIGLNYKSHLGDREPAAYPGVFAKFPTSIIGPEAPIQMTPDTENLHYEAELVVVIGKTAKDVSVENAPDHVFGVTCGNDVSERNWQDADLQWFRAKGAPPQRRGAAVVEHQRPALRRPNDRQLRQSLRHPAAGRRDLYGHAGEHRPHEGR